MFMYTPRTPAGYWRHVLVVWLVGFFFIVCVSGNVESSDVLRTAAPAMKDAFFMVMKKGGFHRMFSSAVSHRRRKRRRASCMCSWLMKLCTAPRDQRDVSSPSRVLVVLIFADVFPGVRAAVLFGEFSSCPCRFFRILDFALEHFYFYFGT